MLHLLFAVLRGGEGLCGLMPSPYACIEKGEETKMAGNPTYFVSAEGSNGKQSKEGAPSSKDGPSRPRVLARGWCCGYQSPSAGSPPPVAAIRGFGEN